MKILPPENPRRLTNSDHPGDVGRNVENDDGARHYHYHASSDAEERIRRDALRDYLHEQTKEREAHPRAVALTIFGLVVAAGGLGVFLTPRISTSTPNTSRSNAVQVTSELRDGKWVATAKRVTVPDDETISRDTSEPVVEDDRLDQSTTEESGDAAAVPSTFRMCEGKWVSPDGLLASVNGTQATLWFEYQVRNGNGMGQTLYGEPVGAGLSFSNNDGLPSIVFACKPDHMLVTRLSDNTSALLAPADDTEFANTLEAWRNAN
ncbi:hypothetical protein [Sphingomonas desiccabilis]|uniref:Uncharacterized protein n=1 Tax=Sphingomonas desiccabilis TaxID=429134 RepID=A0A4Q2IU72_9SPHN|nr:hypothetical protein [Sphingomonas desiccabilis]MBB3911488.1 hypothetical protein [Sphingomonas desiccabilis]RXZ31749.1 hypothetical protein EO081_11100 [Sphingomonas desiccabilis]